MSCRSMTLTIAAAMLACAALNLGCGDSHMPPALGPTPAPLTTPPAPTVRSILPTSGPTSGGDNIRVDGSGFQSGATVLLDGVAAHVTSLTNTVIAVRTPAHAIGPADLVVMNPDGQTATLPQGYIYGVFSITANPTAVAVGEQLTVSFVAPSARGCPGGGDWIAIYRVGDPDETGASNGHSDLWVRTPVWRHRWNVRPERSQ